MGQHHDLRAGAPLAHLQFSVDKPDELMSVVPFHFASLGYRLIKTDGEEWLFARGKKYAGLWSSDVRGFQTALTVRVGNLQGMTRVDCAWVVRMWGAFYTKSEVKKLEEEGRQLAILLSGASEESAAGEADDGANNGKSFRRTVLQWLAMAGVLVGGSYAIYAAMTADW